MVDNRDFFSQFSTREHEVLVCMLAGDSNSEIAQFLELSESSVKRYVRQLIRAAGARGRDEVRVRWAEVSFGKVA